MNKTDKIYIAGHRGMVGSALLRKLQTEGFEHLITRSSKELDLRNQAQVQAFFAQEKPDYVLLAAAKVGGIHANNTYRADFIYENLMIEANVIHAAYLHQVKKLLYLGSSCIYPKMAPQPLKEESLLSGYLEPTNQPYAIAKIAGIELCDGYRAQYGCNFISAMPTNLYGPNDNYDLQNSHVLPAMLRKFITATKENKPQVELWGTGSPKREFLHVDDLAAACYYLLLHYNEGGLVNIGTGIDLSIKELATLIQECSHYPGEIVWNTAQPDGTPRKLMDVSKLKNLGWEAKIDLKQGLQMVYEQVKNTDW